MLNTIARTFALASSLLLTLSTGCEANPDDLDGEFDFEAEEDADDEDRFAIYTGRMNTGRRLNTNHSGNHFFSEVNIDGQIHEGTRLVAIDYDGPLGPASVLPWTIQVVDGALRATLSSGYVIDHPDFNDTVWHLESFEPGGVFQHQLTVETGYDPGSATPLYNFSYSLGHGEGSVSTCLMEGEEPLTSAAVYAGLNVDDQTGAISHDPALLYIGCVAGAVGKASLWNYRPETLPAAAGGTPLQVFQAAVAMIRADYCGDGNAYTLPGTPIHAEDKFGHNFIPTPPFIGPAPLDEAVWGLNGAVCLDYRRVNNGNPVACANGYPPPPCWFGAAGWFSDPSALFWTAS
ncbi:MAG: ADYC domain-containing protein [Myxococcota bacterium]